ncbi:hypothetical protein BKA81DRAFT_67368 [Phyllosticta paracitricarpa]
MLRHESRVQSHAANTTRRSWRKPTRPSLNLSQAQCSYSAPSRMARPTTLEPRQPWAQSVATGMGPHGNFSSAPLAFRNRWWWCR